MRELEEARRLLGAAQRVYEVYFLEFRAELLWLSVIKVLLDGVEAEVKLHYPDEDRPALHEAVVKALDIITSYVTTFKDYESYRNFREVKP